ncbi:Uncharacterized protein APZ42_025949 [Daphnia magna]|uniref:Uncharacterized protein n=1 Tax=Daphnia magna TaxID=35525 RepID=A0A164SMG4_9CRUS|nr:Uncharacterized protein APZ42_025949 [Daphnia magna]
MQQRYGVRDSKILSSSADAPSAVKDDGGSTIRDKGFNGTVELEWLAALAASVAVSQSEMSQLSERSYHSEKCGRPNTLVLHITPKCNNMLTWNPKRHEELARTACQIAFQLGSCVVKRIASKHTVIWTSFFRHSFEAMEALILWKTSTLGCSAFFPVT